MTDRSTQGGNMEHEYEVSLEVRCSKKLSDVEMDILRDAIMSALDAASPKLPFGADVATSFTRPM
jgi:hypothetical protein